MTEIHNNGDLAAARRELGLTQKQLADLADVSEGTVRNIERGRLHAQRKRTTRRIEEALAAARRGERPVKRDEPDYDVEVLTMARIVDLIESSPLEMRARILLYLSNRYGQDRAGGDPS